MDKRITMKQIIFASIVFASTLYTNLYSQSIDLEWASTAGGVGIDIGVSIATDNSNNIYSTGVFELTADFDPGSGVVNLVSKGKDDIFIQKLVPTGDLMWAVSFGGSTNDNGTSISTDTIGNVYVTGSFSQTVDFDPGIDTFNLTSNGSVDIFVLKLDASGNFIWAKSVGGAGIDKAHCISVDKQGNSYLTGSFTDTVDFNPGSGVNNLNGQLWDIFALKLNASGNFVWAKSMGGTEYEFGFSITTDDVGNVYLTGAFQGTADFNPGSGVSSFSSNGDHDIFITKLDASGNFLQTNTFGGSGMDRGNNIVVDPQGDVYLVGSFQDTVDFDPGVVVNNHVSKGMSDMFIQKLDNLGDLLWVNSYGGTGSDVAFGLLLKDQGSVIISGGFANSVDVDISGSVVNLTSNGLNDIFMLKMDKNGTGIWVQSIGGSGYDSGYDLLKGENNDLIITGYFSDTVDFDPGTSTSNLISNGQRDIYIAKYTPISTSINEIEKANTIVVFPNPTTGLVFLDLSLVSTDIQVNLRDTYGRLIIHYNNIVQDLFSFNIEGKSGLYFVEIISNESRSVHKVVVVD